MRPRNRLPQPEAGSVPRGSSACAMTAFVSHFRPIGSPARVLSGKSDVLGAVPGGREPDGPALDRQLPSIRWPRQLAYQQWKLKNAPEPKYVTAGDGADGDGGDSGTESPLVGKPAPDFTLDLVGGKPFHLGRQQGQGGRRARLLGDLVRPLPASDAAGRTGGRRSSKTRMCGSSPSTSRKRPTR